jgi:predicted nucleic acid-binding protein
MGLIYLDSCLLIYIVERHPIFGDRIMASMAKASDRQFAISALVKCECLVKPLRRDDRPLETLYRQTFVRFVALDMPEPVYLRAAELRAGAGLKTPDALHLACAQHHRCEAFWTNDGRMHKVARNFARNVLA